MPPGASSGGAGANIYFEGVDSEDDQTDPLEQEAKDEDEEKEDEELVSSDYDTAAGGACPCISGRKAGLDMLPDFLPGDFENSRRGHCEGAGGGEEDAPGSTGPWILRHWATQDPARSPAWRFPSSEFRLLLNPFIDG